MLIEFSFQLSSTRIHLFHLHFGRPERNAGGKGSGSMEGASQTGTECLGFPVHSFNLQVLNTLCNFPGTGHKEVYKHASCIHEAYIQVGERTNECFLHEFYGEKLSLQGKLRNGGR